MKETLEILDYSVYGNAIDADSDRLIAAAASAAGLSPVIRSISPAKPVTAGAERVWLRYDLRSRADLAWIVGVARDLKRQGRRVFPDALSILIAGDKWESHHALLQAGVPTVETHLGLFDGMCRWPVLLKARVSWGGMSNRLVHDADAWRTLAPAPGEDEIVQPYIAHRRTWIVPVAAGREFLSIEEGREPGHDGDARVLPLPPGGAGLGAAAIAAVGLPAGTVDLIEAPDGPVVLEVNSSPCMPYPDLPGVDLATPMLRAVLDWMAAPSTGRIT